MKNRKIAIICVIIASFLLTAGIVKAAGLTVDWLKVGSQGTGGVTYFNGTIINNTTGTGGADNPVTFGDNVRIDGKVYRGATAGTSDSLPFIVNDNMQVVGSLTVGSITGLSEMVSAAGFAQTSTLLSYAKTTDLGVYAKTTDLGVYAKTTDLSAYALTSALSSYAKTTDLSPYALTSTVSTLSDTVDLNYYWQYAIYQYNRCTLNLDQLLLNPTIDSMLWCWNNWVGTVLTPPSITASSTMLMPDTSQGKLDNAGKLQAEMDRAAKLKK